MGVCHFRCGDQKKGTDLFKESMLLRVRLKPINQREKQDIIDGVRMMYLEIKERNSGEAAASFLDRLVAASSDELKPDLNKLSVTLRDTE